MKNYTITVNGNVYDVTVEENGAGAPAAAPVAAPRAAAPAAPAAARLFSRWKSAKNRTRQTRRLWKSTTSGCR